MTTKTGKPIIVLDSVYSIKALESNASARILDSNGSAILKRGFCWSKVPNPTINDSFTENGNSLGVFSSEINTLSPNNLYYIRAYASTKVATSYSNQVMFNTKNGIPIFTLDSVYDIGASVAKSSSKIINLNGANIISKGICWNIDSFPTINDSLIYNTDSLDTFLISINNLIPDTTIFVRTFLINPLGVFYSNQIAIKTKRNFANCNGTNFSTIVNDVLNPITGRIWMDRNLGATQVAANLNDTNSFGFLYQWGRSTDGHQCRKSDTTSIVSNSITPQHGKFIYGNINWLDSNNTNLWQGVNGINNPCPSGYRLPTNTEQDAERTSWSQNNSIGAFGSPLKLPLSGDRYSAGGSLHYVGGVGYYWSSTVDGTNTWNLRFNSGNANMYNNDRALGFSVRCLKD
jgi:uncharacterized protein (TIGR02145 family)